MGRSVRLFFSKPGATSFPLTRFPGLPGGDPRQKWLSLASSSHPHCTGGFFQHLRALLYCGRRSVRHPSQNIALSQAHGCTPLCFQDDNHKRVRRFQRLNEPIRHRTVDRKLQGTQREKEDELCSSLQSRFSYRRVRLPAFLLRSLCGCRLRRCRIRA